MKIISEGVVKPPFWIGKRVTCQHCDCVYVLEQGDPVHVESSALDGSRICASACPMRLCWKVNSVWEKT